MKKKKIIIISIIVLLILIIATIVIIHIVRSQPRKTELFEYNEVVVVDYPVSYKPDKEGNIVVSLDGSKTPNLSWDVRVYDDSYVDVAIQGKESNGKATYVISPKAAGMTRVDFVRTRDIAGLSVDEVYISLDVYVGESSEGFELTCTDPYYINGCDVIGENTDHPVVLNNSEYIDGSDVYDFGYDNPISGDLIFASGQSDWVLDSPDGYANFTYYSNEGNDIVYISRGAGLIEQDPKYDNTATDTDAEEERRSLKYAEVDNEEELENKLQNESDPSEEMASDGDASQEKPNKPESSEITLSSESLGISETLIVTYDDEKGTVSISRAAGEEK